MIDDVPTEIQTLCDARDEWGRRLLAAIDDAAKYAEGLRLFSSPEAIHVAVIQTAIIGLLCSCDLPEDAALAAELVQRALAGAMRTMETTSGVH